MPANDYKCRGCGLVHEEIRCLDDIDVEDVCIVCGDVCERQFPDSGHFRLRGAGWSKDGYTKALGSPPGYGGTPK